MFIISPINSIRFAKRNSLLPNYANQLHIEREIPGLKTIQYCQKVNKGMEVTIQIMTDYDGIIDVNLFDYLGNSLVSNVLVTEKNSYPDFKIYEFSYTFNEVGVYQFSVTGEDSEQTSVLFESEPISIEENHPNTLLIEYWNDTNTEFVDYSTGIRHFMLIESRIPDENAEVDENIYDNQNKKNKTYSATTFAGQFQSGGVPDYLVRQLTLAQGLFYFFINDIQYTNAEISSEKYGNSTLKQITMKCYETEVPGVNSDDSGDNPEIIIPEEDMNIYPINLDGVTGAKQITVPAGFMLDNLMFVLSTGTDATVKAGTTVGGDEVSILRSLSSSKPVYTIDREYLANLAQYKNAFNIYFTITGVGSTIDINAIIKKYSG